MPCVVLLSGGLDSAVCLGQAVAVDDVRLALTFDYGQRAREKEIEAASQLAAFYRVPHRVIRLEFLEEITRTALVDTGVAVPEGSLEELEQDRLAATRQVWVPNRNGLFINIAACFAEAWECDAVVAGFNREEGEAFPDNTPAFVAAATAALAYSTLSRVRVTSYTQDLPKDEIIRRGLKLGVPLELVWSCYYGGPQRCGRCESCRRLRRAWERVRG